MKTINFLSFLALSLLTQIAFAEGGDQRPNQDFGLNRRVKTDNDFARVTGDIEIHFTFRTVNGVITTVTTPSFYLGGRGVDAAGQAIEVDAGLDFDTGTMIATSQRGWIPYIARSIADGQERTNPRSWNGTMWRIPRPPGNIHHLDYGVDNQGRLRLTTDGLTFYWIDNDTNNDGTPDVFPPTGGNNPPPDGVTGWPWAALGQNAMNAAALNQHSVKRVTALTQVGDAANPEGVLDGTTLTCLFYNGYVYSPAGVGASWTASQTSQVRDGRGTGYDAPQSGILAYDSLWNGHTTSFSEFRVEFPNVLPKTFTGIIGDVPRTNAVQSQSGVEMGVSRYRRETVKLNLKSFPTAYTTFTY